VSEYSPAPITTCDRCGAELAPGARFCANCGPAVGNSASTFASPPAQTTLPVNPYTSPVSSTAWPSESRGGIGKLFSGDGRIGRLEYFLIVLGVWLVLLVLWGIIIAADAPGVTIVLGIGSWLLAVVLAVCAGVKRLHDFNQSGWLYLLFLIPFVSFILLFVLLLKGGDSGVNQYGYEDSGSVMG
jgi:uncharacterized membrane protein YhaH (DUF805 family)